MKLKQNKYLLNLSSALNTDKILVERRVTNLLNIEGVIKDNYTPSNITTCLAVLLDFYEVGIIINENFRNKLINDIGNLELIKN